MKKYLLMFTTALIAAFMVSCESGEETIGTGPDGDVVFTTVSDAVYYGEAKGENSGFYSFVLSNDKGDKLRVDCFGTRAVNSSNAKLTTGDYIKGTLEAHAVRTFFVATADTDAEGTIYWKNNVASLITEGSTFKVASEGGNTKIAFVLKAGEKEIKASFNGSMKFDDQATYADRRKDVAVAKELRGNYYGKFTDPEATTGMFLLALMEKGDAETGADAVGLQIQGFMPLAKNNQKALLAEGVYTIDVTGKSNDAFTLFKGGVSKEQTIGTSEYINDANGKFSYGWAIEEGTMKVEIVNDNYKITVNMKGKRMDRGNVIGKKLENVEYTYEGPVVALANLADPRSSLEVDKALGVITNQALLQVIPLKNQPKLTAWFYYVWGEGLKATIEGNLITVDGEGDMLILALYGPKQSTDLPVGEFPMGSYFGQYYSDANWTMPGNSGSFTDLGPDQGTWYVNQTHIKGQLYYSPIAGAMPDQGSIVTSTEGDIHKITFDFYDRYGHAITGGYDGKVTVVKGTSAAASSAVSVPSYTPGLLMDMELSAQPFQVVRK